MQKRAGAGEECLQPLVACMRRGRGWSMADSAWCARGLGWHATSWGWLERVFGGLCMGEQATACAKEKAQREPCMPNRLGLDAA